MIIITVAVVVVVLGASVLHAKDTQFMQENVPNNYTDKT